MSDDFDRIIERRGGDSVKWRQYDDGVLPLWVADMDFAAPEPVIAALRRRVDHGVFGYGYPLPELAEVLCERLAQRYAWEVEPGQILFLPGLVCALNVICRALAEPGAEVLVQTPVYPPFLAAPANQGRVLASAGLVAGRRAENVYYSIDYAAFEKAITDRTRLFILCHPHNPVGRAFTVEELRQMAEICRRHDLLICSDEVHGDLLLGDTRHRPLAAAVPEIAERCVTLMAPSKSFNLPGLGISFAVIQNPELRRRLENAAAGIVPYVNVLGYQAALAAYRDGEDWLQALCRYLTANRDCLVEYVHNELPGIRTTRPEATYLAWLDCREVISNNPYRFFLENARVALYDGAHFGPGGEGFVRLNFGCPRAILLQALERMKKALSS